MSKIAAQGSKCYSLWGDLILVDVVLLLILGPKDQVSTPLIYFSISLVLELIKGIQ